MIRYSKTTAIPSSSMKTTYITWTLKPSAGFSKQKATKYIQIKSSKTKLTKDIPKCWEQSTCDRQISQMSNSSSNCYKSQPISSTACITIKNSNWSVIYSIRLTSYLSSNESKRIERKNKITLLCKRRLKKNWKP